MRVVGSITGTVWVGGGAGAGAAAAVRGGAFVGISAVGRDAGTGTDSARGSAAGTGSMATRGGGSGISSGTAVDVRAGLDEHALATTIPTTLMARHISLVCHARGSHRRNVVPRPSVDCTSISPPCSCAIL